MMLQQIVLKGAEKLLIALAYNRPLEYQLIIEDKFTVVSILIHRHSEGLLKLLPILGIDSEKQILEIVRILSRTIILLII